MARGGGIITEKIGEHIDFEYKIKKVKHKINPCPGSSRILPEELNEYMLPPTRIVKPKGSLKIVPDDEMELHF
jgi:hypothetical protein